MESLGFLDDLLNFSSDVGDEDDEEDKPRNALDADDPTHSFSVSLILHFAISMLMSVKLKV